MLCSFSGKDHYALFIGNQELTRVVSEGSTFAFFDATFGLIPGRLDVLQVRSAQILNILCDFKGALICIMTIVMSARKLALYQEIFRWFAENFTSFRPKQCMADWETALRKAISTNWPEARLLGCR